jgi:hypothetical protein
VSPLLLNQKLRSVSVGRLVVHFDGKLLPAIAGGPEKEDRVAILVTGLEVEKIVAIPKVTRGTGELVARAASECLHEWNLVEHTVGMSFDTTAANTGHLNGACVLLEQKLGKNLMWLACRHHMLEVVCGNVFKKLFGATSGPNVPLFRRFQEYWPNINQAAFKAYSDKRLTDNLDDLRSDAVSFCMDILTKETVQLPREDYRELLELTLIFLGETPPRGIRFRVPGAFHHARWMSKLLYVLKLNLFQDQFRLTKHESSACLEFALFTTLLYIKAWIMCSHSCDAPANDLKFIHNLNKYNTVSKSVSESALTAMRRHLWYLGQELAPLGLFSVCFG